MKLIGTVSRFCWLKSRLIRWSQSWGDALFLPPESKARILRDAYGVPHIYGRTDVDVAFGFGYAQAEDHLIAMLKNFRQARGRLAEVEGASALELDEMALRWRIHSVAGERYGNISEGRGNISRLLWGDQSLY